MVISASVAPPNSLVLVEDASGGTIANPELLRLSMTAADVMRATPGPERDKAIDDWCLSVWNAFCANRPRVMALLAEYDE